MFNLRRSPVYWASKAKLNFPVPSYFSNIFRIHFLTSCWSFTAGKYSNYYKPTIVKYYIVKRDEIRRGRTVFH